MFKIRPITKQKCSKNDQNVQKAAKMFKIRPIIKQKCSKSDQNVQN